MFIYVVVTVCSAAAVYAVDPALRQAIQQAELLASDGVSGDQFGYSVSVSGDTAIVGAWGKNAAAGAAYIFVRSGTAWTQQAELTASDAASQDYFGYSVSVSGDTVVAGASGKNGDTGAAYVFVRSGTVWTQQTELAASDGVRGDSFGNSVSVSGSTLVAGAPYKNSSAGAAYVFARSGTTWTQQAELTASDGVAGDYFGNSVAVSGNTLVAGAPIKNSSAGAVYVFVRSGGTWMQQAELTASDGGAGDFFGASVSVSGDIVASGAYRAHGNDRRHSGAAYVFVRSGTTWTQQAKLTDLHPEPREFFGYSVSVTGDTVVVGAPQRDNNVGAAYVFVGSGAIWTQRPKLTASDAGNDDFFGYSVSVSGDTVLAGAFNHANHTGAAYVFIVKP